MNEKTVGQLFHMHITANESVTLLPRILQILSRRGFTLMELRTSATPDDNDDAPIELNMTIKGDTKWKNSLPSLISRLIDVVDVHIGETND